MALTSEQITQMTSAGMEEPWHLKNLESQLASGGNVWGKYKQALAGQPITGGDTPEGTRGISQITQQLLDIEYLQKLGSDAGELSQAEIDQFDTIRQNAIGSLRKTIIEDTQGVWESEIARMVDKGVFQGTIGQRVLGDIVEHSQDALATGSASIESESMRNMLSYQAEKRRLGQEWGQSLLSAGTQLRGQDLSYESSRLDRAAQERMNQARILSTEGISKADIAARLQISEAQLDHEWNISQSELASRWDISQAGISSQEGMQTAGFTWSEGESALDRAARQSLQTDRLGSEWDISQAGISSREGMQTAGFTWQTGESEADRALELQIAQMEKSASKSASRWGAIGNIVGGAATIGVGIAI